jgi:hypothetical protein
MPDFKSLVGVAAKVAFNDEMIHPVTAGDRPWNTVDEWIEHEMASGKGYSRMIAAGLSFDEVPYSAAREAFKEALRGVSTLEELNTPFRIERGG